MRILAALATIGVLAGCTGPDAARVEPQPTEPVMRFDLEIPREYQAELRGWTNELSACQRYMDGFERGWWQCVDNYLGDIGYRTTPADTQVNGWGEFIGGFCDGYASAERQIQSNIRRFGAERTHAYLVEITEDVMGP
jgi:hypothetical protein